MKTRFTKYAHVMLLVCGALALHFASAACSNKGDSGDGDGVGDGDGGAGDGDGDNGDCTAVGIACDDNADCCTDFCDPTAQVCSRGGGACLEAGESCGLGLECCTFACVEGECSESQCSADGDECESDGECCGGTCEDATCKPLNAACKTSGNPCSTGSECCSQYCNDDGHCGAPSYCTQRGDVCATDEECCGGQCNKGDGASLGLCQLAEASGASQCLTAGDVCSEGAIYEGGDLPICGGACCSRACFPYGPTGVLICQPPSGCRPTGETCREDTDCCGAQGLPDGDSANITCSKAPGASVGRCNQGNACTPAGGICRLQEVECNANANCCSGNVLTMDTCSQDLLGIPRCLAQEIDCTDPQQYVGASCATSADCCNLPCVPNPEGDPPFVCGSACIDQGGACSTTADCCTGFSCINGVCDVDDPPGGTGGSSGTGGSGDVCAEYGQECTDAADCCNQVPCEGGRCQVIVR